MNLFQMMQSPDFMNRFNQFRQMFQGNPKQQVEQLLQSGKVSQAQYNNAMNMAKQMQNLFGKRY